ncbi:TPA: glycosyltransferase family 39 protein [Candidatus Poribacteria bacterium]|nr:glycosyltransferase family 39 protein [Candidatus Poribacteria bacterium]HIO47016.1 glycosyltransferase family 39 protein [Candidatus Poribacteria bacterium]
MKVNFPFWIVLVAGLAAFALKCKVTYSVQWIGNTDSAVFAETADSFARGKGLSNDFIQYSYFYSPLQYPEINHPDAHYPPLYSLLTVPFYLIFGKTAFAAKLPAMLVSSILLPIFLYLLTLRLSKNRITAMASALCVIVFPNIFEHSLVPDDDGIFHFMVIASCFLIIMAIDTPKYFYSAGVFISLSYYAKGSGLILIPIYFIFCLIRGGPKILWNRKLRHCFLIVFLVMLPWFLRNTIHFGQPNFSTQQYAAGYIGYKGWEEGTYSLYWNVDRPTLFSKLREAGSDQVWNKSKDFLKTFWWWSFVDIDESWGEFEVEDFYTYCTGIPAAIGFFLFCLSCLYFSFCRFLFLDKGQLKSREIHKAMHDFFEPWHNRDFHVLWLVPLGSMVFLAVCWEPIERLAYPFIAINMAIGWTTYYVGITQICKLSIWSKHANRIIPCLLMLLMLPIVLKSTAKIYDEYKDKDFPYAEDEHAWMKTGKWIHENLPGSIIMFREPAQLHFYSEEKTIQVPLANLDQIIQVMKFYKVTHIIPKLAMRPALKSLVEGKIPGFKLVYNQGLEIYEIDYSLLPSY